MATTLFVDLVTLTSQNWFNPADTIVYHWLTSPAGTNTITATGPASMSAYAAGQKFSFLPANDNTGATTINITPSGQAALGAKNIFCGGAACVGGEIQANVPCTVQYDGTQFNLVGPFNGGLVLGAVTLTAASPQLTLGVLNTTSGGIKFFGSTSGNVTLAPNVAAGASVTVTLPATSVTLNAAGDLTGTTLNASVVTSSLTTVGALNSGSITSGFGSIDVGADAISGGAISGSSGAFTANVNIASGFGISRSGSAGILTVDDGVQGAKIFGGAGGGVILGQGTTTFMAYATGGQGTQTDAGNTNNFKFQSFVSNSAEAGNIIRVGTTAAVTFTATSDERMKNVFGDSDRNAAANRIMQYRMRDFEWKSQPSLLFSGPIAQEIHEVSKDPMLVQVGGDDPEKNPWTVNMSGFIPDLIMTAQQQEVRLRKLEANQ